MHESNIKDIPIRDIETREINQEQFDFLKREITRWEEDQLLQLGRGAEILSKYSVRPKRLLALKILGLFGAGVLGVGAILFIAANWGPAFNAHKAVIAVGLMVLCYYAGAYLRKTPLYESIGEPCVLLANLLFGAITMLACQYYHISAMPPQELLVWGVATALVAWAYSSSACAVLSCLGLGIYAMASNDPTPHAVAAGLLAVLCAYITRSPYALGLVLSLGGIKLYMALGYGWQANQYDSTAIAVFGAVCFLLHLLQLNSIRQRILHAPYLLVGSSAMCLGLLMQISTAGSSYSDNKASSGFLWWASMIFVVLLMFSGYKLRRHASFPRVIAGLMYIFSILPVMAVGTEYRLASLQAALVAVSLSLTIYAIAWLERPIYCVIPLVATIGYFSGYAGALSSAMLQHSIVFSGVGALILLIVFSASLHWWRKTRLSPLISSHVSVSGPGQ